MPPDDGTFRFSTGVHWGKRSRKNTAKNIFQIRSSTASKGKKIMILLRWRTSNKLLLLRLGRSIRWERSFPSIYWSINLTERNSHRLSSLPIKIERSFNIIGARSLPKSVWAARAQVGVLMINALLFLMRWIRSVIVCEDWGGLRDLNGGWPAGRTAEGSIKSRLGMEWPWASLNLFCTCWIVECTEVGGLYRLLL